MKPSVVIAGLLLVATCPGYAADPLVTDGDKYKLRIENERMRVLEYHDQPGDRTTMHEHPDFVLYALSSFRRKLTFPDGKSLNREFKAGDVIFMKGQTHIGENIGNTETNVIIVELKPAAK